MGEAPEGLAAFDKDTTPDAARANETMAISDLISYKKVLPCSGRPRLRSDKNEAVNFNSFDQRAILELRHF